MVNKLGRNSNNPVVIVGAGLSGLRAAALLISQGIPCRVLEAKDRIGGRVLSLPATGTSDIERYDLGPTWFWPHHQPVITELVSEMKLETFVQYTEGAMLFEQLRDEPARRHLVPENSMVKSIRLVGGVRSLIDAVAANLPPGTVELNTRVSMIRIDDAGSISLEVENPVGKLKTLRASVVILALPPRIIARRIAFDPALPPKLMASLTEKSTWFAGQAKVVAVYDRPFWRENGLSGLVTSWVGPLHEIHDASPLTGSGALFGFFGMKAQMRHQLGEEKVLQMVIDQLSRLFGPQAERTESILFKDWSEDQETAVEDDFEPLTAYPNYGRPTGAGVWDKKIIFAGAETVRKEGGYLEGALRSAEQAVVEILSMEGIGAFR